MAHQTSQSCPVLSLPIELRIQIYEYVFLSPSWYEHRPVCRIRRARQELRGHIHRCRLCVLLDSMENPPPFPPLNVFIHQNGVAFLQIQYQDYLHSGGPLIKSLDGFAKKRVAILSTRRQLYKEAADVLYGNTLFVVDVKTSSLPTLGRLHRDRPYGHVSLKKASFLSWVKHINMTIQLRRACDFWLVSNLLTQLSTILNPDRKFTSTSMTLRSYGRPKEAGPVTPKMWQHFLDALKEFDFQSDVYLLSWPAWLNSGSVRLEELDAAVKRRLGHRNTPLLDYSVL